MALLPPDPVYTLRTAEMGPVHAICFHKDERIFAATKKGQVYLFDLQTNRSTYNMNIGENPISSIHHTEDFLVTMEKGGGVKVRELTNSGYRMQAETELEHTGFCRTEICEAKNLLFGPRNDCSVSVLALDTLEERAILQQQARNPKYGTVSSLKYLELAGQDCLLAGYESGDLQLWDLRNPSTALASEKLPGEFVTSIDYDLKNQRGICGNSGDKINVFGIDRAGSSIQARGDGIPIKNAGVHCVKIRADHKVFSAGGWDGRIRIFSWKSLRPLAVLTEHKADIMDVAFSQGKVSFWKSNIMAACSSDGQITLWDIYN